MKKGFIIAIDGPVASGKGTIAALLARKIKAINFNTGGVWRAYTLALVEHGVAPGQDFSSVIKKGIVSMHIQNDGTFEVFLQDRNVTELLLDPNISKTVPLYGKQRDFTEFILSEMKRIALGYTEKGRIVVMEGRQIGTDVFPDAEAKIFLTASLNERALRRYDQYKARGVEKEFTEVIDETKQRDELDMSRRFGALVRNPEDHGYFILDTTNLDENGTLSVIIDQLKGKKLL